MNTIVVDLLFTSAASISLGVLFMAGVNLLDRG
jgi:hypothetical protein